MSTFTISKLDAIRAMLAAGHRPIRIERSTLLVWGLATGGLCAGLEDLLPLLAGNDVTRMAALTGAIILGVGALAALLDRRWLMRRRADRGETINFVEAQLGKAWALLFGLGAALTVGTFFFGGQYMIYGCWLVLIGLGLFLHGLFSQQLPLWAGVAFILLGIGPLAAQASYFQMRWIAASALGIGLPLLALLPGDARAARVTSLVWPPLVWTATVLLVAALAFMRVAEPAVGDAPVVSIDAYPAARNRPGPLIVRVPAGARLPLDVAIEGGVVRSEAGASIAVTVAQDLDVLTQDGAPTGWSRVAGGPWHRGVVSVHRLRFEPEVEDGTLRLRATVAAGLLRMR